MTTDELEKIVVLEPVILSKDDYNLAPWLSPSMDKSFIDSTVNILRAGARNAKDEEKYFEDLSGAKMNASLDNADVMVLTVGDLPQIYARSVDFPNADFPVVERFVSSKISRVGNYAVVADKIESSDHTRIVNWMERKEQGRLCYARYWFNPSYEDKSGNVPKIYSVRFEILAPFLISENIYQKYEKIYAEFELQCNDSLIHWPNSAMIKVEVGSNIKSGEKAIFEYEGRNVITSGKKHEFIPNAEASNNFNQKQVDKYVKAFKDHRPYDLNDLVLASYFPSYAGKGRLDLDKTFHAFFDYVKNGNLDVVEGLNLIHFYKF